MTFSGPVEDMFGYTVQQFENEEGKWVLIGSPLAGQPQKKTGDVYKCPVGKGNGLPCVKLNLPANTSIPQVAEVKENMTLGSTLVTNPKGGFLACGPLYAYKCGHLHYTTGICSNVSSTFEVVSSIAPSVQVLEVQDSKTCGQRSVHTADVHLSNMQKAVEEVKKMQQSEQNKCSNALFSKIV